ncbi:hypothetical protein [Actinomadura sp. WMMA1423]|uniref:hypothetical protein n=1 Tax=Actinomadura sp. WMMA1423 TaxID=2591108 RepID=UPI001146309E|nr:hypothetical protein [Actinomadura sp. WMMA1423]
MELVEWPDAELFAVDYLTEVLEGVWSCNRLPPAEEFDVRLPIVDVTRGPGTRTGWTWSDGYLRDEPSLDLDVWAADPEQGARTASRLIAALTAIEGYRAHGAVAGRVKNLAGPSPRPDVSQNITRLGVTATVPLRLT